MEVSKPKLNREVAIRVILAALRDILETRIEDNLPALDETTQMIGRAAVLDSIGFVTLIIEVEQRLESDYGLVVVLTDDRSMSQTRSPFFSVGLMADYVLQLAAEQG